MKCNWKLPTTGIRGTQLHWNRSLVSGKRSVGAIEAGVTWSTFPWLPEEGVGQSIWRQIVFISINNIQIGNNNLLFNCLLINLIRFEDCSAIAVQLQCTFSSIPVYYSWLEPIEMNQK